MLLPRSAKCEPNGSGESRLGLLPFPATKRQRVAAAAAALAAVSPAHETGSRRDAASAAHAEDRVAEAAGGQRTGREAQNYGRHVVVGAGLKMMEWKG